MRKEHSAVDWSKRPLPQPWLEYAALDVEVLLELREVLAAELAESGKEEWADQEFQHLIGHVPPPRQDPWRRTSGIHKAKGRRGLAAVRSSGPPATRSPSSATPRPGRLIPDSAIIAAANALPTTHRACWTPRASTAAVPAVTRTSGSRPSNAPAPCATRTCHR